MVIELRQHLRIAARHQEAGAEAEAQQAQATSDRLLVQLLTTLNSRFDSYARKLFQGRPEEMIEDAIMEMQLALVRDLRDLRPEALHFERRFNQCVQRTILDAIKKVRRENDLDEKGNHKAGDAEPTSLETLHSPPDQPDNATTLPDCISDPRAEFAFDAIECEQLLSHLPTDTHRRIFRDHMNGETREKSAERAGISVRTATNYIKQSRAILRNLLTPRD